MKLENTAQALYNDCAVFLLRGKAVLVGELAVPCDLQPATAGMNPGPRTCGVLSALDKQR